MRSKFGRLAEEHRSHSDAALNSFLDDAETFDCALAGLREFAPGKRLPEVFDHPIVTAFDAPQPCGTWLTAAVQALPSAWNHTRAIAEAVASEPLQAINKGRLRVIFSFRKYKTLGEALCA